MTRALALVGLALVALACTAERDAEPRVEVVAEGLINPIGITLLPDDSLLVAEAGTGQDDKSAGVSLIASGRVDRVVSGLPSGLDSGDLAGVNLVGVSPDGETAYAAHFGGPGLLTFPVPSSRGVENGRVLEAGDLGVDLVPLNRVELVNPFDITFTTEGTPVVTDASANGVATRNPDGTVHFIHRFGELTAPGNESLKVDPVPTGISRVDDEFFVTLTGGCPYPDGVGAVVAIDGDRGERTVLDGLNMPIDVALADDGGLWVLEFADFEDGASCFSGEGYQAGTGRLSKLEGDRVEVIVDDLDFPGSLTPGPDGSVYVTEVFTGRVLQVFVGGSSIEAESEHPVATPWRFIDVAEAQGLDFHHGAFRTGLWEDYTAMMGGGLCWLDADGDGRLDLYLVNSHSPEESEHWDEQGGLPGNALYRNTGEGFEDFSEASRTDLTQRGMGCVAADFDSDGHTDIYVTEDGPNALLINDGSGVFTEVAATSGVEAPGWSTAAAVGDVNGDSLPDLFVGSYIDLDRKIANPSGAFPQDYLGLPNKLFLNEGNGRFREVAREVGLVEEERTLGAVLSDFDGDGDLDLYIANDGQPNRLYENRQTDQPPGLRFVDVTFEAGVGDPGSGMGVAAGDYDEDGATDLFVSNWDTEFHALYRGQGDSADLAFQYSTFRIGFAGFGDGQTGWGTAWGDFDNDSDLDLAVANGRVPIVDMGEDGELVRLFGNLLAEGRPGELRDWTARVSLGDVGPLLGRGSAVADFDDDGDLDIAITQIGGPVTLLENRGTMGTWLGIEVEPATPGTIVTVLMENDRVLTREIRMGGSYLASEDPRAHFGLGREEVREVEVRWPDGAVETREEVTVGQRLVISHP